MSNPIPLGRLDPPIAPHWVGDVLGAEARDGEETEKEGVVLHTRHAVDTDGGDLLFLRIDVPRAAGLDDDAFRSAVARAYLTLAETLQGHDLRPLRIWNYVPAIRRPSGSGFSRYEVFNEGRKDGYVQWYGEADRSGRVVSSGVGHRGEDLVLHVLACGREALPIENPRQRPAYRYSARYGPAAPCFSRAARLDGGLPGLCEGQSVGLVAGTASIVGEDSRHAGDLDAQVTETCLNLATVGARVAGSAAPQTPGDDASREVLARYRELRVYLAREADVDRIESAIQGWLPGLTRLDVALADLCRPELLVEAEGILHCD